MSQTTIRAAASAETPMGLSPATVVHDTHEPVELNRMRAGFQALRRGTEVEFEAPPSLLRRATGATVVWVDDHAENNIRERQHLESLGVRFVLAASNAEALEQVRRQPPDGIISDMKRRKDLIAGYALLDSLRQSGTAIPVIIYSDSCSPERRSEARRLGAFGCTSDPAELFDYVLAALRASPSDEAESLTNDLYPQ